MCVLFSKLFVCLSISEFVTIKENVKIKTLHALTVKITFAVKSEQQQQICPVLPVISLRHRGLWTLCDYCLLHFTK